MNTQGFRAALLSLAALAVPAAAGPVLSQAPADGVTALLRQIEQAVQSGDPAAHLKLLTDSADRPRSADFAATELIPGATRVVIQERDRQPLPGTLPDNGYRVMVDAFAEYGGALPRKSGFPRSKACTVWRLRQASSTARTT